MPDVQKGRCQPKNSLRLSLTTTSLRPATAELYALAETDCLEEYAQCAGQFYFWLV